MSAFSAGPTALTRKIGSPYLPGDDDAEQADGLSDAFSAIPGPPARSRTGGATAVSPGAGANPTSAFSPDPSTTYSTPGSGASQPNLIRDVYAPELQDVSQKLQDAYAAPRPGLFRQIVGALLSKRNPTIGGVVSGETQRARTIEPFSLPSESKAIRKVCPQIGKMLNYNSPAHSAKARITEGSGGVAQLRKAKLSLARRTTGTICCAGRSARPRSAR
jgi:hypothetical protein